MMCCKYFCCNFFGAGCVIHLRGLLPTHTRSQPLDALLTVCLTLFFQDINPAYNLLLRSELLGVPIVGVLSPEKATQLDQLCSPTTPSRRLFRYLSGDTQSPHGGQAPPSPFAVAPIGDDTCTVASQFTSPKKPARRIARAPFKVGGIADSCL